MNENAPTTKSRKKRRAAASAKGAAGGDDLRLRINVLALIEALEAHVLGEKEMTATQVNAALALLKKTLPDISEAARKTAVVEESGISHEDALAALE